jgi:hypothetical protein
LLPLQVKLLEQNQSQVYHLVLLCRLVKRLPMLQWQPQVRLPMLLLLLALLQLQQRSPKVAVLPMPVWQQLLLQRLQAALV